MERVRGVSAGLIIGVCGSITCLSPCLKVLRSVRGFTMYDLEDGGL